MSLPTFTIITPSYNQGDFLEETIRSVLDQGYPNLEYAIVDGGSTDNSVEIIKKYADRLAWWVSEKDRGQSHAINKGFARTSGQVMGFINSDDTLKPGALECAGKQFEAGAKWVVGWVEFVEPGGLNFPQTWQMHERVADWFVTNPLPQQGTFWARELWDKAGPFREDLRFVFDYEFWMRLRFKVGVRPITVRRCLGTYRMHDRSKTTMEGTFTPENESVRADYMKLLPAADLLAVKKARRRRTIEADRLAGWRALAGANQTVARDHASKACRADPFSVESWRLMYCALRGR
jgi:glycosyltransferase involved in cell wall biosynthesis